MLDLKRILLCVTMHAHTGVELQPHMITEIERKLMGNMISKEIDGKISKSYLVMSIYNFARSICERNELNQPLFIRGPLKSNMVMNICIN